jgi:hypothetical protein
MQRGFQLQGGYGEADRTWKVETFDPHVVEALEHYPVPRDVGVQGRMTFSTNKIIGSNIVLPNASAQPARFSAIGLKRDVRRIARLRGPEASPLPVGSEEELFDHRSQV